MSYFLWVEDFENSPDVSVSQVFGKILGDRNLSNDKMQLKNDLESLGIYIELNFQDGLAFIKTRLHEIDYVILDIDLMAYDAEVDPINEDVLRLLEYFQNYDRIKDKARLKDQCAELKKIAGIYLYTELVVEQGFPKSHILFCSNHATEFDSIQKAFKNAKIVLPKIYTKSDKEMQKWVKDRYENPYSCLRRGILEGCRYLENLTPDKLCYKEFFKKNQQSENEQLVTTDDIKSYLKVLEIFLPLREPADKKALYKLFIRTLTHEWESSVKPNERSKHEWESSVKPNERLKLAFVLRNTRHWITHNSPLFDDLNEQMVAYLFFLNMRVLFSFDSDVLKNYEQILLNLFSTEAIKLKDFKIKIERHELNTLRDTAYNELKNAITVNNEQNPQNHIEEYATYFNKMCNNIQLSKSSLRDNKELFMKLIYQMFWLINFHPNQNGMQLEFMSYYNPGTYLFELARHIYNRSFP